MLGPGRATRRGPLGLGAAYDGELLVGRRGDSDYARRGDRIEQRAANPPDSVRGELQAATVVESLRGAHGAALAPSSISMSPTPRSSHAFDVGIATAATGIGQEGAPGVGPADDSCPGRAVIGRRGRRSGGASPLRSSGASAGARSKQSCAATHTDVRYWAVAQVGARRRRASGHGCFHRSLCRETDPS
jgi:hypothetical protein